MTRDDFFRDVLPQGSRVAELGVFLGEFSETILRLNRPTRLALVDLWDVSMFASGDADGENTVWVSNFPAMYDRLVKRYAGTPGVEVHRSDSVGFLNRDPGPFDCVYIDTTHAYEQTAAELAAALPRIAPGGWIAGHDLNEPGVERAVAEFCRVTPWRVASIGNDGCPSFFIQLPGAVCVH
jgi:hypothetical protein